MNTKALPSVTSAPVSPMASSVTPSETGSIAGEPEAMPRAIRARARTRVLGARMMKMMPLSFTTQPQ